MRLRSLIWLVEPLLGRNQLGTLNSCHLNITKPLIIEVDRSCRYLAGSELRSLLSVTDLTAPKTNAGLMNVLHGGRRDHGSNVTFAVLRGIFLGPIFFQSPQVNSYRSQRRTTDERSVPSLPVGVNGAVSISHVASSRSETASGQKIGRAHV